MKTLKFIFLFGLFALAYGIFHPYPPLNPNAIVIACYALVVIVGAMLFTAGNDAAVTATYLLGSLLPWLLAGLLLANGALDQSSEHQYQTVVVNTRYSFRWPGDELYVRSWRPGRTTESLYVRGLQAFFLRGEHVTVGVKPGALGILWVSSFSREHSGTH